MLTLSFKLREPVGDGFRNRQQKSLRLILDIPEWNTRILKNACLKI
jgi:hypothetical protein